MDAGTGNKPRVVGYTTRAGPCRDSSVSTALPPPPDRADPDQPSSVVRTLTAQLTELKRRHHEEVATLRRALEAAHGENLELRRRLGRPAAQDRAED